MGDLPDYAKYLSTRKKNRWCFIVGLMRDPAWDAYITAKPPRGTFGIHKKIDVEAEAVRCGFKRKPSLESALVKI